MSVGVEIQSLVRAYLLTRTAATMSASAVTLTTIERTAFSISPSVEDRIVSQCNSLPATKSHSRTVAS